uniref:Uncharacterized protein n=1 Tax=Trypanosoma congolense (strain IL3000) TaxID=1068625 RepID=F9W6C2_TRYCI|nr:hypothetical protein, unlikely [Trypanosoma congolense IL3000]
MNLFCRKRSEAARVQEKKFKQLVRVNEDISQKKNARPVPKGVSETKKKCSVRGKREKLYTHTINRPTKLKRRLVARSSHQQSAAQYHSCGVCGGPVAFGLRWPHASEAERLTGMP